jgi:membrane associated rhomboid family serine protease
LIPINHITMTLFIILITCVISFTAFSNPTMMELYKFSPYKINRNGEYIRFLSHGFIHADINHLFFNMMTLYFFGKYAEAIFKSNLVFILFYFTAIAFSSIIDYIKHKNNPYYSSVGASGAVNAVLFSTIIIEPWSKLGIYFIIPCPAILFGVLYLGYSYYMSIKNSDNIGHMAHFSGAIFGIVATIIVRPEAMSQFIYQLMHPQF